MQDSLLSTIRQLLSDEFLMGNARSLPDDDTSLSDAGVVDSAGVLTLILLLEERFGIKVEDAEVHPDNLDSIAKLGTFISSKTLVAG
jgi:acyl carrier protein